jgi:hypothetical protein
MRLEMEDSSESEQNEQQCNRCIQSIGKRAIDVARSFWFVRSALLDSRAKAGIGDGRGVFGIRAVHVAVMIEEKRRERDQRQE